jgi:hypothetical protein
MQSIVWRKLFGAELQSPSNGVNRRVTCVDIVSSGTSNNSDSREGGRSSIAAFCSVHQMIRGVPLRIKWVCEDWSTHSRGEMVTPGRAGEYLQFVASKLLAEAASEFGHISPPLIDGWGLKKAISVPL